MAFYGRTFGQVLTQVAAQQLLGITPKPDTAWSDLPYNSGVTGVSGTLAKLAGVEAAVAQNMLRAIQEGAARIRTTMVQTVPQDTGHLRQMLLDDRAIYVDATKLVAYIGFRKELRAGFTSSAHARHKKASRLHSEGIYALWVEVGRKAYAAGDTRAAGKNKRGKARTVKIKRTVGAMAASRFMSQAAAANRPTIQRLREQAVSDAVNIKAGSMPQ